MWYVIFIFLLKKLKQDKLPGSETGCVWLIVDCFSSTLMLLSSTGVWVGAVKKITIVYIQRFWGVKYDVIKAFIVRKCMSEINEIKK